MDLFNSSDFIPRSQSGAWTPMLIFFYKFSNAIIAASYFSIPALLIYLYFQKKFSLPQPKALLNFALFITFCGFTHLMDIIVFHWPAYRLIIALNMITAAFSLLTVLSLPAVIQYILRLKTANDYQKLLLETEKAQVKINKKQIQILETVAIIEAELENIKFNNTTRTQYEYLRSLLKKVKDGS